MSKAAELLLMKLQSLPCFVERGAIVTLGLAGDIVVIERNGNVWAVWVVKNEMYSFVPGGHGTAMYETPSVDDAVLYTEKRFERRGTPRTKH
jgi:hypothetical protein